MYVRLGAFQNKQIPKWALKSESMLHGPTGPTWPLDWTSKRARKNPAEVGLRLLDVDMGEVEAGILGGGPARLSEGLLPERR